MKWIKLFEEYSEELYNRVLDLYNEVGMNGLSPEEKEYLTSMGTSDAPKSLYMRRIMDSPFVVSIGEDISRRYFDDDFWKTGEGINKPWTKEGSDKYKLMQADHNMEYKTFVFKNYKPIPINDNNRREMEELDWDSDYYDPQILHTDYDYENPYDSPSWNELEMRKPRYFHSNYEEGVVFWYFDTQYPKWTDLWDKWVKDGGLEKIRGGSELIKKEVKRSFGYDYKGESEKVSMDKRIEVDLKGQRLSLDIIVKEIKGLELAGKLGSWTNDTDKLLDPKGVWSGRYFPCRTQLLFNKIYN